MPRSTDSRRQYLKLRGAKWYLNYPIPSDVRHLYKTFEGTQKSHIVRALGTSDLVEADYLKKRLVADLEREFRERRRSAGGILPSELHIAREYRKELQDIKLRGTEDDFETWSYCTVLEAERIAGDPQRQTAESLKRSDFFWRVSNGEATLRELFEEWTFNDGIKGRTLKKYRTAFEEFMSHLKIDDGLPEEMTRQAAISYVDWLNREGRSQRTKALVPLSYNTKLDRISALRAFWSGMERRGAVKGRNPWARHTITERPTSESLQWADLSNVGRPKKRKHLSEADILSVLASSGPIGGKAVQHTKRRMMEVFCLALLTGARPEELCSRRIEDISKSKGVFWLNIHEAKNAASDRKIPISHPIAVALLDRLIDGRSERAELLFKHLRPSKTDGTYYRNIGKALQRLFDKVEMLEKGQTPYVARHTFLTFMGNLEGISDPVMKAYVGHADGSITDRHYRTITEQSLLAFARKVHYPEAVERRFKEELGMELSIPDVA